MKKRTLLIVDDQVINRRILQKILADEYELLEAGNGEEAMALLHSQATVVSAVLLDIIMPVMDGYAVLKAMRADSVLSKIPVIVSSQKDGDEDEVHALSLGAQDFIAKPYKPDIIRHRLGNLIRLRETAAMINKVEKDELTGLYNKQFFYKAVEERLQQNLDKKYDMLCFGVEHFRLLNETFGEAKGDGLLRYIARLLREAQAQDSLCGRLVPDLFFVLCPRRDTYSDAYFQPWAKAVNSFGSEMNVKTHCGVYHINDNTEPADVICDRAQLASDKNKGMYDALFCLYDDSLRKKLLEEKFIVGSMQTALEQHQFQVYYQPKYDLNNERVAGAEALVRWVHPERGFLSPGMFIPLFEKNGFITQLDAYVWETACRDIRSWMDRGHPAVAISVNVSRADVYNPKLKDVLLGLLAKYNIPLHLLHLEITESAYTTNTDQIILTVNELRSLGFCIEMDDFGSGYSSLNMLADMPVDVLKLDMGFIQHETTNPSGRGVLSFVISLAKWLNLAVVAEGVETAEQISTLRSMDCNYVQGFYYAKPMKEADFAELLRTSETTEMICTSRTAHTFVQSAQRGPRPGKKNGVMLIVDDIELNRVVLASAFEDEYTIVEKENGLVAWQYLEEHFADVAIVLLDLLMPIMDGFQMLNKLRADPRTRDLPVIITSQGDADSERRAMEMDADDFISKPYNPDIIRHRVHNVVDSYTLRCEKKHAPKPDKDTAKAPALQQEMAMLRRHFDIVRLVDAQHTLVYDSEKPQECGMHACFTVWGKVTRCKNCISLKALQEHARYSKLEYSNDALYYVISEYVPYGVGGAVLELVSRIADESVDNVLDRNLLYANLDKLHEQLEIDDLTGIYNRRHIDRYLESYLDSARRCGRNLCLAMIDVDSFKQCNDSYGHMVGDEVIKSVAQMLQHNLARQQGDFVARYGGDEFLAVCRDMPSTEFVQRVRQVASLVQYLHPDKNVSVSISAGCAGLQELPNASARELLARADSFLYQAKAAGRNRVMADTPAEGAQQSRADTAGAPQQKMEAARQDVHMPLES